MTGPPQLIAKMLYGSGLRISKGLKRPKNSIIRQGVFRAVMVVSCRCFREVFALET